MEFRFCLAELSVDFSLYYMSRHLDEKRAAALLAVASI